MSNLSFDLINRLTKTSAKQLLQGFFSSLRLLIFAISAIIAISYPLENSFSQDAQTPDIVEDENLSDVEQDGDNNNEEKAADDSNKQGEQERSKILSGIEEVLLGKKPIIPSIMFYKSDSEKIERALNLEEGEEFVIEDSDEDDEEVSDEGELKYEEREITTVFLASILYFSKNNWSVWLSDEKITSDNNRFDNEFYIEGIDGKKVKVLWSIGLSKWKILSGKTEDDAPFVNGYNQVEIRFILQPNQTYILKSNKIVEGNVRTESITVDKKGNVLQNILK